MLLARFGNYLLRSRSIRCYNNLVLFVDSKFLALNKPCGILVQGNFMQTQTLLDIGKDIIKQKYGKKGDAFLALVHRLDRVTSGVIIFARNSKSAAKISNSFRLGLIAKTYVCIVQSSMNVLHGNCVNFLSQDASNRIEVYSANIGPSLVHKLGLKKCILSFETLDIFHSAAFPNSDTSEKYSLLRISLETGRKHQIRAQLSSLGFPIVGDVKYGATNNSIFNNDSVALHSLSIKLPHPGTQALVEIAAPPPYLTWSKLMGKELYDKHFGKFVTLAQDALDPN